MRLGQLARKLGLRPSEIVEFLAKNHVLIDDSSNTRVEDNDVEQVMKHFSPSSAEDAVAVRPAHYGEREQEKSPLSEIPEAIETNPVVEELQPSEPVNQPLASEELEVIRAPKVELSGLKVVGKIELPETKKKEAQAESVATSETTPSSEPIKKQRQEDRKLPNTRKNREDQRSRKNPIALERERQAQEAERRRKAREEEEKEQRTRNYLKRVKATAPTRRIRMVEEPTTEMSAAELAEAPRTWLGKFFRWLKT